MNNGKSHREKYSDVNDERKSGVATAVIIISTLFLVYLWPKIETTKENPQKQVVIVPPLDFKELDLKDLKVENKEGGQSTASNNLNRKTNSRNKLTSKQTGGDETPSGSQSQSGSNFDGLDDDGERMGNNGKGNQGDGPDDRGTGNTSGDTDRKLLYKPNIPQYEINYDCKISLKVILNDDGSCRNAKVVKRESNCNDINIINDVIARVKRTIKYNMRTSGAKDHAFFIVRIDSR
ncbi:MAG: hypothetical protein FJX80_11685 [Bacteroidetes bacterium]|nr:hypothetical protein [Bacteroidota bacterium]